jgi:ParB family transcriptional regulator, chromosome partitioning protein
MSQKELLSLDPTKVVIIGLDTEDREEHPLFHQDAYLPLDEALVKNIQVMGVLKPISVRQEAGKYYVIDGRQRVKNAREANRRNDKAGEVQVLVPAVVKHGDDHMMQGIMVSSNEFNATRALLDKSITAARLSNMGHSLESIALQFGKTPNTIRNWHKIADAVPEIHAAVRDGVISFQTGVELSNFPRDEQKVNLDRVLKAQENAEKAGKSAPKAAKNEIKDKKAYRPQPGIKRSWLQKALLSKHVEELTEDQRGVLKWIATGDVDDEGAWYIEFFNKIEGTK